MKLSVFFGKRIITAAAKTGYVISVYADGSTLTGFVCADADEKEFFADAADVKSVKNEIISRQGGTSKAYGKPLRLGKPVFDFEGRYIGNLTDINVEKNRLTTVYAGTKKFSYDDVVIGDAVIIKNTARILKSDVKCNGKTIIRRGAVLTPEALEKAKAHGEYVQANLKTI